MEATPKYTFKAGRKCLHCSKPIADQVHKLRKFCSSRRFPDGTIESCKDDYHTPIRKRANSPYLKILHHHKLMHQLIGGLRKVKGDKVVKEDLNLWGIKLNRPFHFDVDDKRQFTCYYYEYGITQLGNNEYKIFTHGIL